MESIISQKLIVKAQERVKEINSGFDQEKINYKIKIAQSVIEAINELAIQSGLTSAEINALIISTWFNATVGSELPDSSVSRTQLSAEFLKENDCDSELIKLIEECFSAMEKSFIPKTDLHKVMTDADSRYLSSHSYIERVGTQREQTSGNDYTDIEWYEYCENSLIRHKYFTEYALEHYEEGKAENLDKIRVRLKKLLKKQDQLLEKELQVNESALKEMKKKLVKASGRPERGVETLFRLTSKNHYTLNAAVDTKSNILISINSIILSIVLGTMLGKIEEDPHLLVPIIMLAITNLWAIALAVFATRPVMTHGKFSIDDVKKGNTNLLFYGNFHQMEMNEYLEGLNGLMNESTSLYDSIGKDIYFMGIALNKKFTLLRRSFNVFIYGFIASVIVFIACHLFFGEAPVYSF